jgi:hypothetical protein
MQSVATASVSGGRREIFYDAGRLRMFRFFLFMAGVMAARAWIRYAAAAPAVSCKAAE